MDTNTDKIIDQLQSQNIALKARLDEAETSARKLTLERNRAMAGQEIAAAAAIAGVIPQAIPDAVSVSLGTAEWRQDGNGRMIRYNAEGFPDVTDAAEPFGAKSAVHELRKRSPFYWPEGATEPASLPRGGKPTASATDPGAENPWKNFNLTRQSELIASDPARARQLADEAGVPMIPNSGVPRGMR